MNEATETPLSWSFAQLLRLQRDTGHGPTLTPSKKHLWANSVDTKDDLSSSSSQEERAEAMVLGSTGAPLLPRKGLWPRFGKWKAEQQSLTTQATHLPTPRHTLACSSFPPGCKSTRWLWAGPAGPAAEEPPVGRMEGGQGWEGEEWCSQMPRTRRDKLGSLKFRV